MKKLINRIYIRREDKDRAIHKTEERSHSRLRYPGIAAAVLLILNLSLPLYSAKLKKVLILDFNNMELNPDYEYLESSITDAVKKMLAGVFAFHETRKSRWEKVARDNYIYKNEYYTKTAAMNLGLLAKQDVVISGGYRVVKRNGGKDLVIVTRVRILDISKKRDISDFTMEGPADNRLWDSVKKISRRISREAEKILPNKEEWKRMGLEDEGESLPIIENIKIGLGGGGYFYLKGWSEYFKAQQPVVALNFRGNLPFLMDPLVVQLDACFMKHSLKEGDNSYVQSVNLQGDTSNYLLGLFFMYDLRLPAGFGLHPKLGGGYVYQSTAVSGRTSDNFTNSFPFAGGGLVISYRLNDFVDMTLTSQVFVEIEDSVYTYLNSFLFGVSFRI